MDIKIGVIIIGSLLWDDSAKRESWRANLDLRRKIPVAMPIRYGRLSSSRKETYSMVFSHDADHPKQLGRGYVVPYKSNVQSEQDFIDRILSLSDAEGISRMRICRSWGVVGLIINPYIDEVKKNEVSQLWSRLVTNTKNALTGAQREPEYDKFGEETEQKSFDTNWMLTVNLNDLFKNELNHFDALVATSNAVKLNFLYNTQNSIRTFQDKKIARVLKRKYRISLRDERKRIVLNSLVQRFL
jgi:hypothetical protein